MSSVLAMCVVGVSQRAVARAVSERSLSGRSLLYAGVVNGEGRPRLVQAKHSVASLLTVKSICFDDICLKERFFTTGLHMRDLAVIQPAFDT